MTEECNVPFSNENNTHGLMMNVKKKRIAFIYMLDKYRQSKSDENRAKMVTARSEYKSLISRCRYNIDGEKTDKFILSKNKNAKQYWNMLKKLARIKPANIALTSFEDYFKAVNNPNDPFFTPDDIYLMRGMAKLDFQ